MRDDTTPRPVRRRQPTHPGEILREDVLPALRLSVAEAARQPQVMLLRRVIENVKAQNWLAVSLDFVIVVVGVFIGIQVANWNDARQCV